jgi:HEAT repeat protein
LEEGRGVCLEAQRLIAERGEYDFLLRLMAQTDIDPEIQFAIAKTGDASLISILVTGGDLSNRAIAEILKHGNPELNKLLVMELAEQKDRWFICEVIKQGNPERIEAVIQLLEADNDKQIRNAIISFLKAGK